MALYRFGVAAEKELVEKFDEIIGALGYSNRSEALRDLMRDFVIEKSSQMKDIPVVGSITIIYDHHNRTPEKLTEYQHGHAKEIISTMHIHIDHHHCMEIIAVRGNCKKVRRIADGLMSMKGVLHGKLVITAVPETITKQGGQS